MTWNLLPWPARAYVVAVILAGVLPLAVALSVRPRPSDVWLPVAMLLAGAAATRKLPLLGRPGAGRLLIHEMSTMSPAFPVVLASLLLFGTERGILVALASALGAGLFPRRHPVHQAAFTTANLGLAAMVCGHVIVALTGGDAGVATAELPLAAGVHAPGSGPSALLPLLAGTLVYYVVNTTMVALAVALTRRKGWLTVWRDSYLWTAPGFLAWGAVVGMGLSLTARFGIAVASLSFLCLYLVFTSYRIYLEKVLQLEENQSALQHARDELERRVTERTAALAASNEGLQVEVEERRRAEEARQQLLARLVTVQEEERQRISRELHDQMAQPLTALILGLQSLKETPGPAVADRARITHLEELVGGLMTEAHRLARELRPAALDDHGLPTALERYSERWSRYGGMPAHFHTSGLDDERLPALVETTLYRIAQEALTNVHRHARAGNASIVLERRRNEVLLIVEDDGSGFDVAGVMAAPDAQGRLGLLGMKERIGLLGGALEIESSPGCGTTVFARVPLSGVSGVPTRREAGRHE